MDLISRLKSISNENINVNFTLTDGSSINGKIIEFGDNYILIQNDEELCGVSDSMICMWRLKLQDFQGQHRLIEESAELHNEDSENFSDINEHNDKLNIFLDKFKVDSITISDIKPKKYTAVFPDSKLSDDIKRKWDSIISRYQNAARFQDIVSIDNLSEELIELGNLNPIVDNFYYNAGCFKLDTHNYPDSADLFENAFKIDKNPDCLYNAFYSHFLTEDYMKASADLGLYLYITKSDDCNLWYLFSKAARYARDYYTTKNTLEYLSKYIDNQEFANLILQAGIYVLKDENNAKPIISKIIELSENDDYTYYDLLNDFITEIDGIITEENISYNEHFDKIHSILMENINNKSIEYKVFTEKNHEVNKEPQQFEKETPSLIGDSYTPDLKQGFIYRTIPPYCYGFLRDGNNEEIHFSYDDIYGYVGFLESVSDYNELPVFFKSEISNVYGAATQQTATIILPYNLLQSILNFSRQLLEEGDYLHALLEAKIALYYTDDIEADRLVKDCEKYYESSNKNETERINFQPKTAVEWMDKGDLYLELNMFDDAMEAYNNAFSEKSDISSSWYGKGLIYLKTKQYDDAVRHFKKALKRNPYHYHARHCKGIANLRRDNYEDALKDFDKVLDMRPDYQDAWVYKGVVLEEQGNNEEANSAYDVALILNPNDLRTLSKKSSALARLNRLDEALEDIDKVLSKVPDDPKSLFSKGYILQKMRDFKNSLIYINKSLDYFPDNVKALTKKAYVLSELGYIDESLITIDKAINLHPNNPKSWYYKGVIYHNTGKYKEAIDAYDKSLELKPGINRVIFSKKEAQKELDKLKEQGNNCGDEISGSKDDIEDLVSKFNQKYG